eukprot:scaffold89995_cov19-Tisochrysis_lutea.AAC.1
MFPGGHRELVVHASHDSRHAVLLLCNCYFKNGSQWNWLWPPADSKLPFEFEQSVGPPLGDGAMHLDDAGKACKPVGC